MPCGSPGGFYHARGGCRDVRDPVPRLPGGYITGGRSPAVFCVFSGPRAGRERPGSARNMPLSGRGRGGCYHYTPETKAPGKALSARLFRSTPSRVARLSVDLDTGPVEFLHKTEVREVFSRGFPAFYLHKTEISRDGGSELRKFSANFSANFSRIVRKFWPGEAPKIAAKSACLAQLSAAKQLFCSIRKTTYFRKFAPKTPQILPYFSAISEYPSFCLCLNLSRNVPKMHHNAQGISAVVV